MDSYGRLETVGRRGQLQFARTLPHPREKVWRALVEPEHLAAWFPTDIEGDRAEGAALRFVFRHGEGPDLDGKMITYDPPSVLEYRWGETETLRFELTAEGEGTVLTFVNTIDELGKAARDAAGWHVCLDTLAGHLRGDDPQEPMADRWKPVHAIYAERFGPEATSIGPPESFTDA